MRPTKRLFSFLLLFFGYTALVAAQQLADPPLQDDFVPLLKRLSSAEMMGRETASEGGRKAAALLASNMHEIGLNTLYNSYFQLFAAIRYQCDKASIGLKNHEVAKDSSPFLFENNFIVLPCPQSFTDSAEMVFAAYGMISSDGLYNDFNGLDVNGKMVVLLEGYPGQADTLGEVWQRFGKVFRNEGKDLEAQKRNAAQYGAKAILLIQNIDNQLSASEWFVKLRGNASEALPAWQHCLITDASEKCIPVFALSQQASLAIEKAIAVDFKQIAQKIAKNQAIKPLKSLPSVCNLHANTLRETFEAQNIIGFIRGADSSRCIVIGGHYDHLGKRGDSIYFGADDNASGAVGVLALAKKWKQSGILPAVNMVFANWDGEEKGLLGSRAFMQSIKNKTKQVIASINMDMISRSEASDSLCRIVSVGIRAADSLLVRMVTEANTKLKRPLTLDVWDADGHTGSDYGSFLEADIPIITFFTGFHEDYHSPRDVFERLDARKMEDVLDLVNRCIAGLNAPNR